MYFISSSLKSSSLCLSTAYLYIDVFVIADIPGFDVNNIVIVPGTAFPIIPYSEHSAFNSINPSSPIVPDSIN